MYTWARGQDDSLSHLISAKLLSSLNSLLRSSSMAWTLLNLALIARFYMRLKTRIQRIEVLSLPKNGWTKKGLTIF